MTRLLVAVALLAIALASPAVAADQEIDTRVPVYVFTLVDASGLVDAETTARLKTVKGIGERLHRSKAVRIVETPELATLVVEVLPRTAQVEEADSLGALSNSLNALAGGLQALRPRVDERRTVPYRYATLTKDAYTTELGGRAFPAGIAIANAIEAWVKTNQAQLPPTNAQTTTR